MLSGKFIYSVVSNDEMRNDYKLTYFFVKDEPGYFYDEPMTKLNIMSRDEEIIAYVQYCAHTGKIFEWSHMTETLRWGELTAESKNLHPLLTEIESLTRRKDVWDAVEYSEQNFKNYVSENGDFNFEAFKKIHNLWSNNLYKWEFFFTALWNQENSPPAITMFSFDKSKNQTTYYFRDIAELVLFDTMEMQRRGIELKRCQNCGKYFVPESRSDEIYCNNIFKGNRTCRQIGYENKINGDEVLREYRKIYKTQNARKQRNKDNIQGLEERFAVWSAFAKGQLIKCQNGEISVDDMKTSISTTDWMKGGQ